MKSKAQEMSDTRAPAADSRLRVAMVDIAAFSGGALSILKDFVACIASQDIGVDWVCFVSSDAVSSSVPWVRIERVHWPKRSVAGRLLWECAGARVAIRKAGVDGVLSMQNMTVLGCSLPQVVYVHQPLPFASWAKWSIWRRSETEMALRAFLQKPLIVHSVRVAERTIVQTRWMKEAVAETAHVSPDRIEVIWPTLVNAATTETGSVERYEGRIPEFFYPAAPWRYKDHATLERALRILQDEGERWTALFTITGNENACARQIANEAKGLGGGVVLAGQLPRKQIAEFYAQSILVFPSWLETFGLPLMEVREAGGWVVAADTPFAREILDGYPRAVFSKRSSPVDLAGCMRVAWNARHDSAGETQAEDARPARSSVGGGWEGVASTVNSAIRAAWLRREAPRKGSLR